MARPRGFRLNRSAFQDLLKLRQLSMTETAELCGLGLTNVSNVVNGTRAGIKTVRALAAGLGCEAETLFPELGNFQEKDPVAVP